MTTPNMESYKEQWSKQITMIKESVNNNHLKLNDWESNFMYSISEQFDKGLILTFHQSKCLRAIYNRIN